MCAGFERQRKEHLVVLFSSFFFYDGQTLTPCSKNYRQDLNPKASTTASCMRRALHQASRIINPVLVIQPSSSSRFLWFAPHATAATIKMWFVRESGDIAVTCLMLSWNRKFVLVTWVHLGLNRDSSTALWLQHPRCIHPSIHQLWAVMKNTLHSRLQEVSEFSVCWVTISSSDAKQSRFFHIFDTLICF